jgi:hypothetical protein
VKALRWVLDCFERRQSLMARDVPPKLKSFVWQTLKSGWADFVESAGILYPEIRKRQSFWTSEKALQAIRRLQAEGHPMHCRGVRRGYEALLQQARSISNPGTPLGPRLAAEVAHCASAGSAAGQAQTLPAGDRRSPAAADALPLRAGGIRN